MSFAEPNQILVSRSYYEITSRLSKEITELFTYSGVKQDKHVREHEVYSIGATQQAGIVANNLGNDRYTPDLNSAALLAVGKRWWPVGAVLIVLLALTVVLANGLFVSDDAIEIAAEQDAPDVSIPAEVTKQEETKLELVAEEMPKQTSPDQSKPAQPKPVQSKPKPKPQQASNEPTKTSTSTTSGSAKSDNTQNLSWESFKESVKQGSSKKGTCSDAERSLKQCE